MQNGKLVTPDEPTIPFIAGDGIGPEIWSAAKVVFDAAVKQAYNGNKKVDWKPLLAGEVAYKKTGEWLPQETLDTLVDNLVAIKGPLTTPIGKGHRSINVTLRQKLDLYACFRPVKYFKGVPSPVTHPENVDIAVFRENTEDIYAGIDFSAGSDEATGLLNLLKENNQLDKVRFPKTSNFAIKPVSSEGSKRIVHAALDYAFRHNLKKLTLVHKGNIMKKTEGGFKQWGYEEAETYGDNVFTMNEYAEIKAEKGQEKADEALTAAEFAGRLIVNDVITDNFFQQALLHPENFDVVVTMNLNGDYISDALAAQVGGIGISPGGNINYQTGQAIFEATHGTAPQFAGQNKLNPTSLMLSGAMMFDYIGWHEVATLIEQGIGDAIAEKHTTMDFARNVRGSEELSTSGFGDFVAKNIEKTRV
ncbi:NADP-dependent isocitrate dehydrogenase [Companilactobacillus ginsenosidimutans]|uniref:Isocitrate dehydrogenase [NADP] n=1 Tax=Companilactobacillus ginsenosidimutans TaxID=1007676 RepID=A0A0H4QMS6_9LACO|nr:NADP-dependent isocitrate dehydrogenase [Companilactobacillus ginsenosidimutans]AKP68431.1 isocitrate dehydrogenase [Companilactobacillus ginsenosidimutans]